MPTSSGQPNPPALDGLRGARLHEGIVLRLRDLIRQGELRHGSRLPPERALAGQFGVGRSSVREAIRSLELQGLVVTRHGSGSFVNTQSLEAIAALMAPEDGSGGLEDIFEMRHVLEPQIAALAAHRATAEDIQRLATILEEQQRQILEGETGVDADTEFHFTLATATHNPSLVKLVSAVEDVLRRSRDRYLQQPGRPERSLHSHHEILAMVQAGDDSGARRAMDHHLTAVEPANISDDGPEVSSPPPHQVRGRL